VLLASGELDRLVASLVRHCDRAVMLSDMEAGRIACTRIGGPLLFGRLWERLGIAEVSNNSNSSMREYLPDFEARSTDC
jgi:hypothetical protein